jgi:hypothetical protein
LRRHIAYLKYVLRHKWFVLIAAVEYGIPGRGLIHDWHKFLPSEWFPYAQHFYQSDGTKTQRRDKTGYYKPDDTGDLVFDFAWYLHQKRARHHWQSWVMPRDDGTTRVFEMGRKDVLEMIADWKGAGRAQGTPDTCAWYWKHHDEMQMCPKTRELVEWLLQGYT